MCLEMKGEISVTTSPIMILVLVVPKKGEILLLFFVTSIYLVFGQAALHLRTYFLLAR